jgi:GAF domain
MGTSGASRWPWDFPERDAAGMGRTLQTVLGDTEAALLRSAARLRASGREVRARQVERLAGWARFDLDEPVVAQELYEAAARLRYIRRVEPLADQLLEQVLSLARADRGNVQLADPASGALAIIAQHGFDAEFLDHFTVVDDDRSACGRAARHGAQLVITDVSIDPGFEPHREIAAAAGFRAVQSTPLTDKMGRVIGVVSTHYPCPYAPPDQNLRIIKRYADLVGPVLAAGLSALTPHGSSTA